MRKKIKNKKFFVKQKKKRMTGEKGQEQISNGH